MSLALKLVVIEGGLTAAEPPVVPPAQEADRLYLAATPTRAGDFAHFVGVSLTIHAAILAGCLAWSVFGEERASGGTEELVVIEGVNVVMLDQLESAPSPLAEASEIEASDEAVPIEEAELAAIAPADALPPTENAADVPPAAAEAMAAEARPPVEARVIADQVVEPAPTQAAEAPTASPADEAREIAEAVAPEAEASAVPMAKIDTLAPIDEDNPVGGAKDLSVAADETATQAEESTVAAAEDLPAPADQAVAPADDRRAAVLPDGDRTTPIPDVTATEAEAVRPAEAPPVTDVAKDDTPTPKPLRDEPVKPAPPEAVTAEAPDPVAKPVEETKPVVAAVEPVPVTEATKPKAETPPPPPKKAEAKKKQVASAASPSAAASQATPTARGPTKTTEKAGAGGKASKAQGKASISSYRAKIFAHLRRYQSYPAAARAKRLTGRAVVRITIGGGGRLVGAALVSSSGHAILDKEVLAMARRAAPYPPIPAGMSAQIVVQAPIRFGTP